MTWPGWCPPDCYRRSSGRNGIVTYIKLNLVVFSPGLYHSEKMSRRNNKRRRKNSTARYRMPRPELKHFDVSESTILCTSGGVFGSQPLNGIATGTTQVSRIGDRILIKKIGLRMMLSPTDSTDDGDAVRILLILDHQPNGADPAVLDILQTASEQAFKAVKSTKRFQFIMDKYVSWSVFSTDHGATPTDFAVKREAYTFFKEVNIDCEFIGSGTAISTIGTNALHMFCITNQGNDSTLLWSSRVSYYDS